MTFHRLRRPMKPAPAPIIASDGSMAVLGLNRFRPTIASGKQKRLLIIGRRTPAPRPGDRFTICLKNEAGQRIEAYQGIATSYRHFFPAFGKEMNVDEEFCLNFGSFTDPSKGIMELGYRYWDGESEADVTLHDEAQLNTFAESCGWRSWAAMHRFYAKNAKFIGMQGTLLSWDEIEEIEHPLPLAA